MTLGGLVPEKTALVTRLVLGDLDALVDRVAHRILTEIPFYAAGGAGSEREFRAMLRVNVESAVHGLHEVPEPTGVAFDTGRIRARQHAPQDEVLTAYRIGFIEVYAAVTRAALDVPGLTAAMISALGLRVFETHNRDAGAVMAGYRDESQFQLTQAERQRAGLMDVLLSEGTDTLTLLEVAQALRLPLHGRFVVVFAASEHGEDPMPRIASALAAQDVVSVWRQRYDASIGILSLGNTERWAGALAILERHARGPVGISPAFDALRRTPWALDLAHLVCRRLEDRPMVEQFEDTPLSMLVAGGRSVAHETARAVLGDLLTLPPKSRDPLLGTLHTWVEAAGSANRAGELMHCHPNTVRLRLRKLEELTGRRLSEPGGVAEVVAASHAWAQLRSEEGSPESQAVTPLQLT